MIYFECTQCGDRCVLPCEKSLISRPTFCPYGKEITTWSRVEVTETTEKPPVWIKLSRPAESSSPDGEINPEEIACILRKAFGNEVNARVTIRIEK